MKLNIKTILIIFLVALIGGACGTAGALGIDKLIQKNKTTQVAETTQNVDENLTKTVTYATRTETNYTEAINEAIDTVVEVECLAESTSNYIFTTSTSIVKGSGVIISSDGYIITNEHVVEGVTSASVKLSTGEEYDAEILGSDARTDIAVLKIEATNLPYAEFANSDEIVLGQEVLAIGNSLGLGITCSNGIISALEREILLNDVYMTLIQTNAAVNEGNSGGGLFDMNGNLVGIVNSKKSSTSTGVTIEGMGYAIPSNLAQRIAQNIIDYGYVKDRASMGINVGVNSNYYFYGDEGLTVTGVTEGSGAEKAGIEVGDIIIEVDGIEVDSYASLSKILDAHLIGDTVVVTLLRNDRTIEVEVELTEVINQQ